MARQQQTREPPQQGEGAGFTDEKDRQGHLAASTDEGPDGHEHHFAQHENQDEPPGNEPAQCQSKECRSDVEPIDQRIEQGTQRRSLIESPGQVSIEPIGYPRDHKDDEGPAVTARAEHEPEEQRNAEKPEHAQCIRDRPHAARHDVSVAATSSRREHRYAATHGRDIHHMLVTLSGEDRPGITHTLFAELSGHGLVVSDIEQLVIRDRLVLAVMFELSDRADYEHVASHVAQLASELDLTATIDDQAVTVNDRRRGRFHVTMLGSPLRPHAISQVTQALTANGANIDRIRRIAKYPVTAVAFEASGGDLDAMRRDLSQVASGCHVDIAIRDAGLDQRGQHLVVMDVDSTLIQNEVIDVMADFAGVGRQVAQITARAMAGELDFVQALQERVSLLAGLPDSVLEQTRAAIRLTPGARTLCRTLLGLGYRVCLVSGGFTDIIEPLAQELGVDGLRANRLEIIDGKLTGRLIGPVVDRTVKRQALEEFAAEFRIPMRRTIAIGDGANDVDMIQAAGLGVAFNAKSPARAAADAQVNVPYLDSVLYLLGMSREDIEQADARAGLTTPAPDLPRNDEIA